jgi:U3 small nucleolar RNA-associated protein 5
VICASQTPFILDVENPEAQPLTFPAMANPIHTLFSSSTNFSKDDTFLAADSARYVTVFDPKTKGIAHSLIAENDVLAVSLYSSSDEEDAQSKQVLAVLVNDGTVELFNRPFVQLGNSKTTSLKARAKQMTRKADAVVKIVNPESRKGVSVVQTNFQGSELFIAWAEGGVNVVFERVNWQSKDTDELALSGVNEISGRKSGSVLYSTTVKEARNASKSHVNENNAAVDSGAFADDVEMKGTNTDDIDAISISDEGDSSEDEAKKPQQRQTNNTLTNGAGSKDDVEMQDADSGVEEDDEDVGGEPSFGELAQRNSAIDVEAELEEDNTGAGALVPGTSSKKVYQIPSGVSLSTVLSQALKTNDVDMLESCFHTSDLNIVRATIQRLDSTLAGTLLQKVSERMASRPGRYGHLLVWVQWTCIAHGGAIAGNTDVLKRMTSLYKVMDQRSRSLPSLLLLKGKLDMLDAQVNMRQSMSETRKHEADDEEILENVTHYAGVNDDSSEAGQRRKRKAISHLEDADAEDIDELQNGFGSDLDDDEDDEGSEEDADEDAGLIDIEAEEYAGSSDAEESLEGHEDDDDEEEGDDDSDAGSDMVDFIADSEEDVSDEGAVPAPPQKKAKLGGKSRKGGRS